MTSPRSSRNVFQYYNADDLILVSCARTPELAIEKLQEDLDRVITWCNLNRLTPNVDKTKFMWFTSYQKLDNTLDKPVNINNVPLGKVEDYKYLGIWLDSTLTFKRQLEDTQNRTSARSTQFNLIAIA